MKRYNYVVGAGLLAIFVTLAYAAPGDKLFKSPGNFIIDAITDVKIITTLRSDTPWDINGTQRLPGFVPVGGMLAVMPSTSPTAWQPDSGCGIKNGFVRAGLALGTPCSVPVCADCAIPQGTLLPNMVGKFARGNTTSGTTGGGSVLVSNSNIPQIIGAVTSSGIQSQGHTHTTSHSHPGDVSLGNSAAHSHTAQHYHGTSIGFDSATHYHVANVDTIAGYRHSITNGAGENHSSAYGANNGAVTVFRFGPVLPENRPVYVSARWSTTASGAHTHGYGAVATSASSHGHGAAQSTSGGATTNNNEISHAHSTISTSALFLDNSTVDHTHNTSFDFTNGGLAVNTTPTNIEVVWVVRVR